MVDLADLVDGADIGVVERGGGAGLAQEAGPHVLAFQGLLGEDLQRHGAVEIDVLGPPDLAHTALT
jgi:hypothetical protein